MPPKIWIPQEGRHGAPAEVRHLVMQAEAKHDEKAEPRKERGPENFLARWPRETSSRL